MQNHQIQLHTRTVAGLGILFAMALVLSLLEGAIGAIVPIPGVRLGLSNIAVMYCVFLLGAGPAWLLGVLKAMFVLMVRGMTAALLSFAGGMLSIGAMLLLRRGLRCRNVTMISVAGAVAHNLGQLAMAAVLLRAGGVLWYYLPVLLAAGILVGMLTAALLRVLLPLLRRFACPGQIQKSNSYREE